MFDPGMLSTSGSSMGLAPTCATSMSDFSWKGGAKCGSRTQSDPSTSCANPVLAISAWAVHPMTRGSSQAALPDKAHLHIVDLTAPGVAPEPAIALVQNASLGKSDVHRHARGGVSMPVVAAAEPNPTVLGSGEKHITTNVEIGSYRKPRVILGRSNTSHSLHACSKIETLETSHNHADQHKTGACIAASSIPSTFEHPADGDQGDACSAATVRCDAFGEWMGDGEMMGKFLNGRTLNLFCRPHRYRETSLGANEARGTVHSGSNVLPPR